jgi:UDP-N-acetylmuramoyl-L-alanyl-D-glutamate--2,6-diaminopimelate ligase
MSPTTRLLGEVLADAAPVAPVVAAAAVRGDSQVRLETVVHDSRRVVAGALYCCVRGDHVDGHDFAAAAVDAGASALLVDHELPLDVTQVIVSDTRRAMGPISAAFHGHPSRALTMVGVTGTNGKTTTTSLIASILESAGMPAAVIGTLTGSHTTPEGPELQELLAEHRDAGKQAVVMEVSSHALALHRVDGTHFDLAVFTNLGRDHLDLHGTVERYFAAKARLFEPDLSSRGVANVDDLHGRLLADGAGIPMDRFSIDDIDHVEISPVRHSYRWRGEHIAVGIGGEFNVMNSLAAAAACATLGLSSADIAVGLGTAQPVPGRFEPIRTGQQFSVIVDYAHTPDGLRAALSAARAAAAGGRVIAVFGCGGDRDRDKRPEMGMAAAELADHVVVTSDNPRSEDPQVIIDAVIAGVPADYRAHVVSEPDRRRAFSVAFQIAQPGDVVVIAGKGHETTQTIGATVLPFDDRAVARELLETMS